MTRPARVDGCSRGATREPPAKSGPQRGRATAARGGSTGKRSGTPGRTTAETMPQRGRTAALSGPSNSRGPVATRSAAATEPFLRLLVVAPALVSGLDRSAVSSDNPAMDPVIAALAQLVRDRYDRERAEKAAKRQRLRVVEGKSA